MANLITVFRIISSLLLLLVPTFSFGFYFLYLFAGFHRPGWGEGGADELKQQGESELCF